MRPSADRLRNEDVTRGDGCAVPANSISKLSPLRAPPATSYNHVSLPPADDDRVGNDDCLVMVMHQQTRRLLFVLGGDVKLGGKEEEEGEEEEALLGVAEIQLRQSSRDTHCCACSVGHV